MRTALIALDGTMPAAALQPHVPARSAFADVEVLQIALAMPIGAAIATVLEALPRTPALDVTALGNPSQLDAVVRLHAARSVLQALTSNP